MKLDIIVSWPNNCDYPIWREFIARNRDRFDRIIVVITETNDIHNYTNELIRVLSPLTRYVLMSPIIRPDEDWRNVAINYGLSALSFSNSPYVWFTEQDFFIKNIFFWRDVYEYINQNIKTIGIYDNNRLHPCCLFLEKKLLNSLTKNFSASPPDYDHFGFIQAELIEEKEQIAIIHDSLYYHMNGLSHNWRLIQEGKEPNYHKQEFDAWIVKNLASNVPQIRQWVEVANNYLQKQKM